MPRVTVCIPTFNGERFVGAALKSVLAQTYNDIRVVVSDDCSADRTREIVEDSDDPRVDVCVNDRRLGLVGNWNRCLELASGEYTHIFHQDDLLAPNFVDLSIQLLDAHPECGFVFSNIVTIDPDDAVIGGHWSPVLPREDTVFQGQDLFRMLVQEGNFVPCQSVFVRTSIYRESGGFDRRLRYTPDLEMWLRLCLRADVAYVAQPLVQLRRHGAQESTRFMGQVQEVDEVWRAFQIAFSERPFAIPRLEECYALAMTHLIKCSLMYFRWNLAKSQLLSAGDFARRALTFWWARRRGWRGSSL